jgi:hypothetical protein
MIATWPIFTVLHGPTSVNAAGELLGLDSLAWGSVMEGPSLLLIAAGLAGARRLIAGEGRPAAVGWWLVIICLVVQSLANLAVLAPWPPLLAPVVAAGLLFMARGHRGGESAGARTRLLLYGLGATQTFAFLWFLAVRPATLDQIDGYRIYGLIANVLYGLGWVLLGLSMLAPRPAARTPDRP